MAGCSLATLVDLFHAGANINPSKVAVVYDNGLGNVTLNYAELKNQASQVISFQCNITK
jgi:non-ribosomal peptide synthetase component F